MVFQGHVENGTVILDEPIDLPNGARVRIELLSEEAAAVSPENVRSLGEELLDLAGRAEGLPADAAQRHDDYLVQWESS